MYATLYPPGRALRVWLKDALRRLRCRHVPVSDEDGYPVCARCRTPLL